MWLPKPVPSARWISQSTRALRSNINKLFLTHSHRKRSLVLTLNCFAYIEDQKLRAKKENLASATATPGRRKAWAQSEELIRKMFETNHSLQTKTSL